MSRNSNSGIYAFSGTESSVWSTGRTEPASMWGAFSWMVFFFSFTESSFLVPGVEQMSFSSISYLYHFGNHYLNHLYNCVSVSVPDS